MSSQLSFFSAGSQEPRVDDLAGVLCGPGQIVRRGSAARVSVVLADDWRVSALWAEFERRGLDGEVVTAGDGDGWSGNPGGMVTPAKSVRTPFASSLSELAAAWGDAGGGKRPPRRLVLDGPALRLWFVVAGRAWESGFAFGLGEHDEPCWDAIGAALAGVGLPCAFVGPRGDGPAYRLTGRRRVSRLAELVGEPPPEAPEGVWPT